MFQALVLVFVIATASATYYGDEFVNYVDHEYEDAPRVILPYAYQNHKNAFVEEQPVYAAKYEPVIVPAVRTKDVSVSTIETSSIGVSSYGLSSLVFNAVALVKSLLIMAVKNIVALAIGGVIFMGIYQLVSVCLNPSTFHYLGDVHSGIMSIATPDAISRATEFVVEAVRKYRSLQNS